jgi:hypothetical protein
MNEREETEMINESGTYLRFLVDFWGNLAQDVAVRMQTASEEIDHRRYTPTKLASDAMFALLGPMQHWVDACVGAGSAPVPLVLFRINLKHPPTGAKHQRVGVHARPYDDPECSDLYRLGGSEIVSAKKFVRVKLLNRGRLLEVGLRNLLHAKLKQGLYQGIVSVAEHPLATIELVVKP